MIQINHAKRSRVIYETLNPILRVFLSYYYYTMSKKIVISPPFQAFPTQSQTKQKNIKYLRRSAATITKTVLWAYPSNKFRRV